MPSPIQLSSARASFVAFTPVLAAMAVWLREAAWFKSFQVTEALPIVAFVAGVGGLVFAVSAVVLSRLRGPLALFASGLALGAAALLAARGAASAAVAAGFSAEQGAYTSLLSVVASKRGLLFVLCVACVPPLLAAFRVITSARKPASDAVAFGLGLCVLAVGAYVAAT